MALGNILFDFIISYSVCGSEVWKHLLGDNFPCLLHFYTSSKQEALTNLLYTVFFFFEDVCIAMSLGRQIQCVFIVLNRTHLCSSGSSISDVFSQTVLCIRRVGDLYRHYSRVSPCGSQHVIIGAPSLHNSIRVVILLI